MQCDYLVVGAGTACMSFVDTLLTENSSATVILADRNSKPGGHWTSSYSFVKLHQPSCNYGCNSLRLGKVSDSKGREKFDISDRATGQEIVAYYEKVAKQFVDSGRVQIFFSAEYNCEDGTHKVTTSTGKVRTITCGKVVTVATDVVVPSMRDPLFPVHSDVNYVPVNSLPAEIHTGKCRKYIVIGAGKTGADAVVHLLRNRVDQSQITWVIPRDVWFFLRDGIFHSGHSYWKDADRLFRPFETESSTKDIILSLERDGILGRLDPDGPYPEVFKGPTIDIEELTLLRSVKGAVRLGRVTSIREDTVVLERGSLSLSSSDTLIVDCMAEGIYGYSSFAHDFTIFEPGRINLGPMMSVFNPSFTSAIIAFLECTFRDDDTKNDFCYFPRGEHCASIPSAFLVMLHAQLKTFEALGTYTPAMKFVLNSRTNGDAPMHHGGTLKLIWAAFGPLQLDKKGKRIVKKVESGGFTDVKDSFNNGRPVKPTPKGALRPKETKKKAAGLEKAPYPPPMKSISAASGRSCCMSIKAVA